jgi:hypothetical protein
MATKLGMISVNHPHIIHVDGDPSATGGTPAPLGSLAIYDDDVGGTGKLWQKFGVNDTDWDIIPVSSQSGVGQGTYLRIPIYDINPNGFHIDDTVVQNTHNIDIAIQAQASRSQAIEYRIPNPGDAVQNVDFVLTEGAQTINGDKTFGNNVIIQGNLTVNGSLTYINTTQLQVTDPLITLNKGGAAGSAAGVGLEIEEAVQATVACVTNTNCGFVALAVGALGNGKTITITDSGSGGLSLTSDSGSALVVDLGGTTPNAATFNALGGLVTAHMTGTGTLTAAEGPLTLAGGGAGISGYLKTSSDRAGFLFRAPAMGFYGNEDFSLLSGNRTYKHPDASGTYLLRPDATPGVAGQVAYFNDANNIVSSANFFWDNTNTRLGIGTNTPTDTLDVNGTARLRLMTLGSVIFAAASGVLSQDNSFFFYDASNHRLGLGTTTPARLLDVNGKSIFRDSRMIDMTTTVNGDWEEWQSELQVADGGSVTTNTLATIPIPTNSVVIVKAVISARRTGGTAGTVGDCATYERTARFKNIAGTVTMPDSPQADWTSEDQKSWNATMDVSSTDARIMIRGAANNSVDWLTTYFVQRLAA